MGAKRPKSVVNLKVRIFFTFLFLLALLVIIIYKNVNAFRSENFCFAFLLEKLLRHVLKGSEQFYQKVPNCPTLIVTPSNTLRIALMSSSYPSGFWCSLYYLPLELCNQYFTNKLLCTRFTTARIKRTHYCLK